MDMVMNPAWLGMVTFHSSREFECGDMSEEDCAYYMERWHFWYIADYVYALPTIAFFMTAIGIFTIGHIISSQVLGYRRFRGPNIFNKLIAGIRYLSYRGFHVKSLQWNSAPLGVLFLGLAGAIFFILMDLIPQPYYWPSLDWGGSPPLATRSGWMALACMPFIFATASKTNWITLLTGVSHERLQVFHRWISYAFFLLALLHTFPFIVYHVRFHDMESTFSSSLLFYWTGIVALIFQGWLTFASHGTIRKLGYEFFKAAHLFGVVIFMVTLFWHCDYTLSSWDYFVATAAVYVPCYTYPWLRTCFEYGIRQKAQISVEDNGFIRITIPATFRWEPGHHCFLRFTGFGILQAVSAHPFTICSLPAVDPKEQSELVFYVRHEGGFTKKLYDYAIANPGALVSVLVDGPYGGINLRKYHQGDQVLVIAGGSGAGWCLPFIEKYLRSSLIASDEEQGQIISEDEKESPAVEKGYRGSYSRPLSMRVVLTTRDIASRMWFLQEVEKLQSRLSAAGSFSSVHVQVFLTGEAAAKADDLNKVLEPTTTSKASTSSNEEISSAREAHSSAVPTKEFEGRPQLPMVIKEEAAKVAEAGQSLSVFVCGPTTMQNDVRNAVAEENLNILKGSKAGGIYLHSEHFAWA